MLRAAARRAAGAARVVGREQPEAVEVENLWHGGEPSGCAGQAFGWGRGGSGYETDVWASDERRDEGAGSESGRRPPLSRPALTGGHSIGSPSDPTALPLEALEKKRRLSRDAHTARAAGATASAG
jgi:hypothetical protein